MPPALQFLSYIPGAPEDEQSRGRTVIADREALLNGSLFSTFAIYQEQNQLYYTQILLPLSNNTYLQQPVIPELDIVFKRLYTRFRNKYNLQFPNTLYTYCLQLLFLQNIVWERFKPEYKYLLLLELQILLYIYTKNRQDYIAIYKVYKIKPGLLNNPGLWPKYLTDLLYQSRIFLSPLILQTSLGRIQSYQL
jgi:hypothetical protein